MALKKANKAGCNKLLSVDQYNECFYLYFGSSVLSIGDDIYSYSDIHCWYFYGLRKLCGLKYAEMSSLFGLKHYELVWQCVHLSTKKLCVYDSLHSMSFVEKWVSFRKYCRLFAIPLSNADRQRNWRIRQRNKKKRK